MFGLRTRSAAEDLIPRKPAVLRPTAVTPLLSAFPPEPFPKRALQWRPVRGPLPRIAPGQIWVIEAWASGSALRPFERAAFTKANVAIYDRDLAEFVAASLPLGNYAEAHRPGIRQEFARALQLALDGWSVVRLIGGKSTPESRADRLRRIAGDFHAGGVTGESPVRLVMDVPGGYETADASLGDLADPRETASLPHAVTAVFAAPNSDAAAPHAVVDNGLAG